MKVHIVDSNTSRLLKNLSLALVLTLIAIGTSCQGPSGKKGESQTLVLPSAGCTAAWADSAAFEFADYLERATEASHPVWQGYRLGDGAVVLHAGKSADSTECLGLWQNGKAIAYTTVNESPKLLTPLYGYHLNFDGLKATDEALVKASVQPEPIRQWLEENNVKSAVLMPVDFPNFPFKIPALKKMQIAIHEAFHVEVMLRYWYTGEGQWPAWDEQPDRSALQNCYNANETVQAYIKQEQQLLSELIEQLIDGNKEQACKTGRQYLQAREFRYAQLIDVKIDRQDGTQCDCAEAENIMELEEGLADYASWTMLYELGVSSRDELINRYRAAQNEPFYLTGAMLLHAVSLMKDGAIAEVIEEINRSADHQTGAPLHVFIKVLEEYCDSL